MSPFAEVSRLLGVGLNGVALTPARLGWQPRVREVIGGRSGRGARGPQPRDGTAVAAIGAAGVRQNKSAYTEAVPDSRLHRLRRQARNDADTLLDKAIDYVENNPAMFPEYDPKENIRRRVLIKGGFIL